MAHPTREAAKVTSRHADLIGGILDAVQELSKDLGKPFTPDGKFVGDIGEVVVAWMFDLKLLPDSTPRVDAVTDDNDTLSIKATFGNEQVAFRGDEQSKPPDLVVAVRLRRGHEVEVVYAGPAGPVLEYLKPRSMSQRNGQKTARLTHLRKLNTDLNAAERLSAKRTVTL